MLVRVLRVMHKRYLVEQRNAHPVYLTALQYPRGAVNNKLVVYNQEEGEKVPAKLATVIATFAAFNKATSAERRQAMLSSESLQLLTRRGDKYT